ncbi:hypothetical protein PsYK624_105500 [Phanerochaete sordida]|uniref:Uncharacterized protein n=1 Tax=Phanerochaete sordida TaxID=48140 RepID=A0A9P3GGI7_9APHY|nr:hypothetical protein PsYK624_105500 [Phanerochaete sordida]
MFAKALLALGFACAALSGARAESHHIHFVDKCGGGTSSSGATLESSGHDYTSSGPLLRAIAYLQTGSCGATGSGCNVVEMNLQNPSSSIDVVSGGIDASTISVAWQGCSGAYCNAEVCICPSNNAGVEITFCAF